MSVEKLEQPVVGECVSCDTQDVMLVSIEDGILLCEKCGPVWEAATKSVEAYRARKTAFASTDWLAELEAALSHAQKARDTVPKSHPRATHDLLACAESDLRAVLREERSRSANEKLTDAPR